MNLRKLAKGMECQVRIPFVCNHNTETTVLAHVRLAGTCGVGMKPPDLLGAWICSSCHDLVDARKHDPSWTPSEVRLMFLEGMARTINELVKRGKLK